MPYLWHTKLMPVNTFACDGPAISIRAVCKSNTNQRVFKGSRLTSLYLMGLFEIGHMEVRYSSLLWTLTTSDLLELTS